MHSRYALNDDSKHSSVKADNWYVPDLEPIVRLNAPGTVETKNNARFVFSVCSRGSQQQSITLSVIATDVDSAFSTYLCNSERCQPFDNDPNVVGYDLTSSPLNVVIAQVNHLITHRFSVAGCVFLKLNVVVKWKTHTGL